MTSSGWWITKTRTLRLRRLALSVGEATTDFTLIETGNFLTDAMKAKAGADVALFLDNGKDGKYNGKGSSARFRPQTTNDVIRALPDMKHGESGVLQVVDMTGENLLRTLEYAIQADNDIRGWFDDFSGLKMTYAPSAMPGKRIIKITDAEGKPLEAQRVYTAAGMDQTFPEDAIQSLTDTGISIQALLTETIQSRKSHHSRQRRAVHHPVACSTRYSRIPAYAGPAQSRKGEWPRGRSLGHSAC